MRPRHVCRGMGLDRFPFVAGVVGASMRPRHVCRGMPRSTSASSSATSGFNEAPACLPGNDGDTLDTSLLTGALQ